MAAVIAKSSVSAAVARPARSSVRPMAALKPAAANGNGNGNTNGNGNGAKQQLFGGLLGRKQQPVEEVQEEPEEEVEPEQETASKKERAFNLLGAFRR
ncbi:hypothetical protein CHLRE_02g120200v5 [Chlamydomonas reinhardtii]|uniref:Uncharacterized protein n=1 Tax=Chlamydomonas reinhardtii TaxID=3055 RepID=A0A2K3E3M8_CHLRE|nr:uncharacterized protein CHLRE_02g120200v5 [Chlamydomonas reinhardtii]PNW87373.1 hypothetical protein CHLRE_02g120200v5 [Chlamydomonas reinhardtii]